MSLYIDLTKAGQLPSTSVDRKEGTVAARAHKESFNRVGGGALGGDPSEDDPDVGARWPDRDDDEDMEADRKRDSQISQERGVTKKPEETSKSEAVEILKSFSSSMREQMSNSAPNEREMEYLTTVCGYEREDVIKGRATIVGPERSRFNDWLHQRFQASIGRLLR